MAQFGAEIETDLKTLDAKIKVLKMEYEQYFLGSRPREPMILKGEVQKMFAFYSNIPIQNTGYRFKFNNLRAKYFSFRRHWDETCRKIEQGTYERHVFKANLRDRERTRVDDRRESAATANEARGGAGDQDLFESYVSAREACGQGAKGITPDKLQGLLQKQEAAIREKYGVDQVKFKVVVEDGRAKLKASPVR